MSKASVAPQACAAIPPAAALADVTITWPYQSPWMAQPETRTITGDQLARGLDLVVRHLELAGAESQREATIQIASYHLEGLSEILEGLSDDAQPSERDHAAIYDALADYAMRLAVDVRGVGDASRSRVAAARVAFAPAPQAVA